MTYEIWLTDNYSYFAHGKAHHDGNYATQLKHVVRSTTTGKVRVLIVDDGEIWPKVRYNLQDHILDFYDINENTPELLLHNESNKRLQIGKIAALAPGTSARVDLRLGSMSVWRDGCENKPTPKILRNCAKCLICGEILESTHRHDLKTCSCGNLSVDGGHDYIRRGFEDRCAFEELSEYRSALMPE